jgi:Surface lipoprotein assembly modifier
MIEAESISIDGPRFMRLTQTLSFRLGRSALGVLTAMAVAQIAPPASAAPIDDLRAEVEAGRSAAAYAPFCAGSADRATPFELWCGVAAVDIGRPGEGVLALERYVLQFPDDVRARLELARAYFYARDDVRARQEFETVSTLKPPAEVQAGIDRYLAALSAREARYRGRKLFYVETGAGYDNNANAGVAQADLGLPVLGQVTISDFGLRKGSSFGWLAAGGEISEPVTPGWTLIASVAGNGTYYGNASEFNLANFGGSLGASYQADRNTFTGNYAHGEITLDGSRYRWTDGVAFEWRREINERATFSLSPQFARLTYSGDNSARDANLTALSASYRQVWLTPWQPVLNASAFFGHERNREDRGDLGRRLWGATADVTVSPSPRWALNAGVGYTDSDYDDPIPLLEVTRRDHTKSASLGALYLIDTRWSVRAEYQYARNTSNLELYEYTRQVGALKLRYEFK